MNKEHLNEMSELARIHQLIRSGDNVREIENHDNITTLVVMGDYFVELTLDKKTRELKGMEIKEDSGTLLKYFGDHMALDSDAA
jgi:hypothetical protein